MSEDRGYFPKGGSLLRQVQQERAVGLMYGQRALGIGAIKPLNFVGTMNHTRFPDMPFQRLTVTGKMFETIFFGTRKQADKVLAVVERLHGEVHGELTESAGITPKGAEYSAFDRGQMLWTIAVAADSAKVFYEFLVRPLSPAERDAFWADYVRFGELFGMPRDVAPVGWGEFREYFDAEIEAENAYLTKEAKEVGSMVMFGIPFPPQSMIAKPVHDLLVLGSLPPRVRNLYGVSFGAAQRQAFAAAVRATRASRPITPARIRYGYNTVHFDAIAKTEKRRAERDELALAA